MTLATFLVGLVGPLAARLLAALGVSLVTMGGLVATTAQLKTTLLNNVGGIPGDGLMLAGSFGIWTCVGLWLGSLTFVITWKSTTGFIALAKT